MVLVPFIHVHWLVVISYFHKSFIARIKVTLPIFPADNHRLPDKSFHEPYTHRPPGELAGAATPCVPYTAGGFVVFEPFIHVHSLMEISYFHKSPQRLT